MGQLRPHALGQSRLPGTGFRACPSSLAPPLPSQGLPCPAPSYLTFTGKVLDGHVLDGNLLEEEWLLAPGVPADDPPLPQPLAEPGQVAVAVEGVGQEVSARKDGPCLSGSLLLWERPQAPVLQRPRGPALRAGLLRGQRVWETGCRLPPKIRTQSLRARACAIPDRLQRTRPWRPPSSCRILPVC